MLAQDSHAISPPKTSGASRSPSAEIGWNITIMTLEIAMVITLTAIYDNIY